MLIREAVVADAAAIAKVGVDTWRSAYRGIMPDERLEALSYESATERNRQRLESGESGSFWLVADSGEEVVGFASAGPAREEEAPGTGEVYGIYVLEAHQRKGIGRMLMEEATRRLLAGGMQSLVVWVLKEGPARGFYEHLGGELVGTKRITTGGCELEAVSYWWPDAAVLLEGVRGPAASGDSATTGSVPWKGKAMSERQQEGAVEYLDGSEEIVGYRTKIRRKGPFRITGYTLIVPPKADAQMIPRFWSEVRADGSLEALAKASPVRPWTLGLGSWDEECEPGGQRYTICIEETEHTDLSRLTGKHRLHTQRFEACDWMCFEMAGDELWRDDPYMMLRKLGYRFHLRVGVHFDAYPPEHDPEGNPAAELWISVAKASEECEVCGVREECAGIQPFE